MSALAAHSWKLDRYARFVCDDSEAGKHGEWKHSDDSNGPIVLTVTDVKQLIISQNSVVFESHSLARAWLWMRGLSRNDSLLFMYKFKAETRRFRVRFSKEGNVPGTEICTMVVQQLATFFPIKTSSAGNGAVERADCKEMTVEKHSETMQSESLIPNKEMENNTVQLSGEVTLGVMAQTILYSRHLPLAYHEHQENLDMIPQLVRMCLGDPAFPAFVESVEVALKTIVKDSK